MLWCKYTVIDFCNPSAGIFKTYNGTGVEVSKGRKLGQRQNLPVECHTAINQCYAQTEFFGRTSLQLFRLVGVLVVAGWVSVVCRWWWCSVTWCGMWCHVAGCDLRRTNVAGWEVTWCEVAPLVATCHVMRCDVTWCDVMWRHVRWCNHVVWCALMWCAVIWCDAMRCDTMQWDGMLYVCDAMWLVVRSCYAIRSGCQMWWIGRLCAVNYQCPYDNYYEVLLCTIITAQYHSVLPATTQQYQKL